MLLLAATPMAYYAVRAGRPGDDALYRAGAWLGAASAEGDIVLAPARLRQAAFYADRARHWPFGDTAEPEYGDPATAKADWLVWQDPPPRATEEELAYARALMELRADDAASATFEAGAGRAVRVVRLRAGR